MSEDQLRGLAVRELLEELSSSEPVPGGGSAAALAGATGAALVSMVAQLTVGRPAYAEVEADVREIGAGAERLRDELLALAQKDADAYAAVVRARRLPKETDAERVARADALDEANLAATEVPLETARRGGEALRLAERIAPMGSRNAVSDAGVAALLAAAAVRGAILNVQINLPGLPIDSWLRAEMPAELDRMATDADAARDRVMAAVAARMAEAR